MLVTREDYFSQVTAFLFGFEQRLNGVAHRVVVQR